MRESIRWFAERMEEKLACYDERDGWSECELDWLQARVSMELEELAEALRDEKYDEAVLEAADAANFLMMIADNCSRVNKKKRWRDILKDKVDGSERTLRESEASAGEGSDSA